MPWHMPTPRAVSNCPCDPVRAGFPYLPEGVGWCQKVPQWCCLSTSSTQRGWSRREGVWLIMVWVHPYQARVSTIDEAAKQLTQLPSVGPDWPYALVWLNGDGHHVPLPTEGHLSVMTEGNTSNVPCGKICQLEVHQLLISGSQVVYLEGLNGCQVPVVMTLPELLSNGMTMLKGKPTFLQVDLSQYTTKEQEPKASYLSSGLSPPPASGPTRAFPARQRAKAAWPWRSANYYSRQFWILLD